jgi:hypothetical protein
MKAAATGAVALQFAEATTSAVSGANPGQAILCDRAVP